MHQVSPLTLLTAQRGEQPHLVMCKSSGSLNESAGLRGGVVREGGVCAWAASETRRARGPGDKSKGQAGQLQGWIAALWSMWECKRAGACPLN